MARLVHNFIVAYAAILMIGYYCMEKDAYFNEVQIFDEVFLGSLIIGGAYPMFISGILW